MTRLDRMTRLDGISAKCERRPRIASVLRGTLRAVRPTSLAHQAVVKTCTPQSLQQIKERIRCIKTLSLATPNALG